VCVCMSADHYQPVTFRGGIALVSMLSAWFAEAFAKEYYFGGFDHAETFLGLSQELWYGADYKGLETETNKTATGMAQQHINSL